MATVTAQKTKIAKDLFRFVWANLHDGDVGERVDVTDFPDLQYQCAGDFGAGGTVFSRGSVFEDGSFPFPVAIDVAGTGPGSSGPSHRFGRALRTWPEVVGGGEDVDITVILLASITPIPTT